jgi:hypothetical protein
MSSISIYQYCLTGFWMFAKFGVKNIANFTLVRISKIDPFSTLIRLNRITLHHNQVSKNNTTEIKR